VVFRRLGTLLNPRARFLGKATVGGKEMSETGDQDLTWTRSARFEEEEKRKKLHSCATWGSLALWLYTLSWEIDGSWKKNPVQHPKLGLGRTGG
jgi:hypothetical protein